MKSPEGFGRVLSPLRLPFRHPGFLEPSLHYPSLPGEEIGEEDAPQDDDRPPDDPALCLLRPQPVFAGFIAAETSRAPVASFREVSESKIEGHEKEIDEGPRPASQAGAHEEAYEH